MTTEQLRFFEMFCLLSSPVFLPVYPSSQNNPVLHSSCTCARLAPWGDPGVGELQDSVDYIVKRGVCDGLSSWGSGSNLLRSFLYNGERKAKPEVVQ